MILVSFPDNFNWGQRYCSCMLAHVIHSNLAMATGCIWSFCTVDNSQGICATCGDKILYHQVKLTSSIGIGISIGQYLQVKYWYL